MWYRLSWKVMPDVPTPESGERGDEIDDIIGALSKKHRRFVLHDLSRWDGVVSIQKLAHHLTDWDATLDYRTVLARLVHQDLPVLEAANLVSFDRDSRSVTITARGECANRRRGEVVSKFMAKCY